MLIHEAPEGQACTEQSLKWPDPCAALSCEAYSG